MKKSKSIVIGIILIAIGIILGGNALELFDINVFFDGWWTLFLIIPSFIGLFSDDDKTGSLIVLLIGVLLLLGCQDILDFDIIWRLIVPAIIIIIGLSLIFKDTINKEVNDNIKKLNKEKGNKDEYCATFSGQDIVIENEEFKGTTVTAVFGGVKLDLRNAIINEDVVINTSSIFGGIEITVPDNYKVKVKSSSMFGGATNTKKNNSTPEDAKTIYINASCIFGGVKIR